MGARDHRAVPRDTDDTELGPLGVPKRLGYGAVLLAFRLLVASLTLLWIPLAEPSTSAIFSALPGWYAQAIFVCGYCLYSILIFSASGRNPRAHAIGSVLDLVLATVLVAGSGGSHSPFYAVYIMFLALSAYHFGLTIGLGQGLAASVLWICACYQDVTDHPRLEVSFLLVAPIMMGMLAGVLRQGVTSRSSHEYVKAQLARAHGDILASYLASLVTSTAEGRAEGRSPDVAVGNAWAAAEVRSAAVLARDGSGRMVLAAAYHIAELGPEVGKMAFDLGAIGEPEAGVRLADGDIPALREVREATAALSRGEVLSIIGADGAGVCLLVLASRRGGADPRDTDLVLTELQRVLGEHLRG